MPASGEAEFPTEQAYNDAIAVLMGGRAGEEILIGAPSILGAGLQNRT